MAAVTALSETPAAESAGRPRGMQARRRRRLNLFRYVVFTVFGLFFLVPLLAMARFSLEGATLGTWSLTAWKQIASYQGTGVPPLISSIEITLELAIITCAVMLVLLVPTMIWVRLRVRWLARTMEFLCLLPLTSRLPRRLPPWRALLAKFPPKPQSPAGGDQDADLG